MFIFKMFFNKVCDTLSFKSIVVQKAFPYSSFNFNLMPLKLRLFHSIHMHHKIIPLKRDHKWQNLLNLSSILWLEMHCAKLRAFQMKLICEGIYNQHKKMNIMSQAILAIWHCQKLWMVVSRTLSSWEGQCTEIFWLVYCPPCVNGQSVSHNDQRELASFLTLCFIHMSLYPNWKLGARSWFHSLACAFFESHIFYFNLFFPCLVLYLVVFTCPFHFHNLGSNFRSLRSP